jgi:hypothetical protein
MRRIPPLAVLVALVLAASAAAGAPKPPPIPGQPLAPPIKLPWPKPGKVAYVSVTLTGVLKPGAKPTFTPVAYGRPPAAARIAGAATKPKTAGGKTTVKLYFAIKNIAQARRLAIAPTPQVDVFGNPADWQSVSQSLPAILTCLQMKAALMSAAYMYAVYSFGDPPEEMWQGALKLCS